MTFEARKQISKPLTQTCDHIWRASVHSEKQCACVRTERCSVYTNRHVHGSGHCLDVKLPENLRIAQDYEWRPDSSELDNNWDLVALTFPHESACTSGVWRFWRCRCYRWSHHSLSCHPSECQSCHWWSQDEELQHVGLSVHVEDEEDEKYVGQLKLNHSRCCRTAGSNVSFCLVRNFIGMWGTPLPWACWRLTRACADD